MLIIGLTGGIGSGKTTVSQFFENLGTPVIDADHLTRALVAPGQAALCDIAEQLGNELILSTGELDRALLRQRIFEHPEQRIVLEGILHPRAREAALKQLAIFRDASSVPPYVILSVPLLIESGWTDLVHRVLVIDVAQAQQQQRASERDGLSAAQINAAISTQADRNSRLAAADDVIHNNADLQTLETQVKTLHQCYEQLARSA